VQLANIPEVLLHYRTWAGNSSRKPNQDLAATQIVRRHAEALGVHATDDQIKALQGLARDRYPDEVVEFPRLAQLIMELRRTAMSSLSWAANDEAIDLEAAIRLWQLALKSASRAPRISLSLAVSAVALSPQSAFSVARKVVKRLRRT
jgi:hypothetical protein